MNSIAICAGSVIIHWSGVIIALGTAACFALSYSLYTTYSGSGKALWCALPFSVVFSVLFCRLLHWYCHMEQYSTLWQALTDYSRGGYCLPGVVLGVLLAAYIVGRLGFTSSPARMLDALAPGAALCAALIRLSAVFGSSCRGRIIIDTPILQHLPLACPVYSNGVMEYRFATFFVEFIVMLAIFVLILLFYYHRRSLSMYPGVSGDGHTARVFLLLYSAVEFILDSTRYDSSYLRFICSASFTQIFSALCMLAVFVYYTRRSIGIYGRTGKHVAFGLGWLAALVCAFGAEYYVQRHANWYLGCYFVMLIGVLGLTAVTYLMYLSCCKQNHWEELDEE